MSDWRRWGSHVFDALALSAKAGRHRGDQRTLPMRWQSVSLALTVYCLAALGYLYWLLAAKLFDPYAVGLASGVVSASMLCAKLAELGLGSALVALLPEARDGRVHLLNSAFSAVAAVGVLVAGACLAVAAIALQRLGVIAERPEYAAAFLLMGLFWSLGGVLDDALVASGRADVSLVRNAGVGLAKLLCLPIFGLMAGATSSLAIYATWVIGAAVGCLIGTRQLRGVVAGYRYQPAFDRSMMHLTMRTGLPFYVLNLALMMPTLIIPIVIIELLSPTANAYWYAVWMMAGLAFIIPASSGKALFVELSNRPQALVTGIAHSLRHSLTLGIPIALGLALVAEIVLSILGSSYAIAGATPLRILVIGVVPLTFLDTYVGACRAMRKLPDAIVTTLVGGVAATVGAAVAGQAYGLTGVAVAWLLAQTLTGLWAGWRLQSFAGVAGGAPAAAIEWSRPPGARQPVGASDGSSTP